MRQKTRHEIRDPRPVQPYVVGITRARDSSILLSVPGSVTGSMGVRSLLRVSAVCLASFAMLGSALFVDTSSAAAANRVIAGCRLFSSTAVVDGVLTFSIKNGHVMLTIKDGVLSAATSTGKNVGSLKKVERKSPTLGAPPPPGATVLFDGTGTDHFENGRMTDDGLLMEGVTSKQKFQDFTLHMEFRTPFKPAARGQGRGNSGVYLQGRYEVQVLGSARRRQPNQVVC